MSPDTPALQEPGSAPQSVRPQRTDADVLPLPNGARKTLHSSDLLGGATAVDIEHLGQTYRLQTTRAGKLILTK